MISSMTGFAKAEQQQGPLLCQIEIRSVNSRHLDSRVNLPKSYQQHEERFKKQLRNHLQRGKVDCHVNLTLDGGLEERLCLHPAALANLKSLQAQLAQELGQPVGMDLNALLQIKGLFTYEQPSLEEEATLNLIESTLEKALAGLTEMRRTEGKLLAQEIHSHLDLMDRLINEVPAHRMEIIQNYKERLTQRMTQLGIESSDSDARLMQEIGLLIDRSDVTEEVERFNTHLTHFRELMATPEPVGRKMDFMMQEFNREANTLCSKAGNSRITEIGVTLKVEIEKIREQVQNIE